MSAILVNSADVVDRANKVKKMPEAEIAIATAPKSPSKSPPPTTICSPMIGVLCIDAAVKLQNIYGNRIYSYIAASYVKYLESAGARVVPIWIGKERSYYEDIMTKINGLFIPGGAVFFESEAIQFKRTDLTNECVKSARIIYDIAMRKNDKNDFFPLWGTCLGLQLMLHFSANNNMERLLCASMEYALPLDFTVDFRESRIFANLDKDLEQLMRTEAFGYHYHRYCITKEILKQSNVDEQWHILATNKDENGLEFISIIEHKTYPFFGCQIHPEKICFEFLGPNDTCPHQPQLIDAAQYFAKFFVDICRKSCNHFPSMAEEMRHVIWQFNTHYTGQYGANWLQCYLFEATADYPPAIKLA